MYEQLFERAASINLIKGIDLVSDAAFWENYDTVKSSLKKYNLKMVSAVKKHEKKKALVVRLYNPTEQLQLSTLRINPLKGEVTDVLEANLMEEVLPDKSYDKNNIKLKFLPKKIITLVVLLNE
jgi:alpha-mannosidase